MNLEETGPIKVAGEREVDFTIVQLLEASADFRQWLVAQVTPHLTVDEYLGGIIHASYAGEGESDIEFGIHTATGDRHLVLIENKIDAAKQPNQIERYYNRGRFRVERRDWDSFSVCLLAPESYASAEDEDEFDLIIRYEAVLDYLDELSHDSVPFFERCYGRQYRDQYRPQSTSLLHYVRSRNASEMRLPYQKSRNLEVRRNG
jgi:hypothetical protein